MAYFPGQKVICIRDCWDIMPAGYQSSAALPKVHCEYVVRTVHFDEAFSCECIRLVWLHMPLMAHGWEPAFAVVGIDGIPNFKPVEEKKTDISIFTALLNPSDRKVKERIDG